MLDSAFDLGEELSLRKIDFILHPTLWVKYDLSELNLDFNNWQTIKYLNDAATDFHADIETLPNNKGGIYLFSINCPIIPGRTEYPVYIGRAQLTDGQNLRKRCKEYLQKFAKENERPKITKMFKYWARNLYLSYIVIDDNEAIKDYEKRLINSMLLPFNDEIPDKEIKQAVKAF